MRVKRVTLGKRLVRTSPPRPLQPHSAAKRQSEQSPNAGSLKALVRKWPPVDARPRHPDALSFQLGLSKYSSGPLPIHRRLQRALNIRMLAVKVYSSNSRVERVQLSVSHMIQNHMDKLCGTALQRALGAMVLTAEGILASIPGTRDVFLQFAGPYSPIRPLAPNEERPEIGAVSRRWNLYCRLHRQDGHRTAVSKPLIHLESSFSASRWCTLKAAYSTVPWQIRLRINGHIRQTADESPGSDASSEKPVDDQLIDEQRCVSSNPFQTVFDDIVVCVTKAISRRTFREPNNLLYIVQQSLKAHLSSSALGNMLELFALEVCVQSNYRERYAMNTLLDRDGNDKTLSASDAASSLVSSHSSQSEGGLKSEQFERVAMKDSPRLDCGTTSRSAHMTLSSLSQEKTKLDQIHLEVRHHTDELSDTACEWSTFLHDFDKYCRSSSHVGLACMADVLKSLREKSMLPSDADVHISFAGKSLSASQDYKAFYGQEGIRLSGECTMTMVLARDLSQDRIIVTLPPIRGSRLNISVSEGYRQVIDLEGCHIKVHGELPTSPDAGSNLGDTDMEKELAFLASTALEIVDHVCRHMVFDTYNSAPSLLAETLRRTLSFLTSSLQVADVDVRFDEPKGMMTDSVSSAPSSSQAATWAPSDAGAPQQIAIDRAKASNDGRSAPTKSEQGNKMFSSLVKLESGVADTSKNAAPSVADIVTATSQAIKPYCTRNGITKLRMGSRRGDHLLEEKTGISGYGYTISWPLRDRSEVQDCTSAIIDHIIKSTPSGSPYHGLRCLQHLTECVASSPPFSPDVEMTWKGELRFQTNTKDGTKPLKYGRFHVRICCGGVKGYDATSARAPTQSPRTIEYDLPLSEQFGMKITSSDGDMPHWVRLYIKLSGKIPDGGLPETGAKEQLQAMSRAVGDLVKPLLASTSFADLEAITRLCAEHLVKSWQTFSDCLGLERAEVASHSSKNTIRVKGKAVRSIDSKAGGEEVEVADGPNKTVFVAVGSNVGDRLEAIESACKGIDDDPWLTILGTSNLYETEPMYVEDQACFLNGVLKVKTGLKPMDLLDRFQAIERRLGRVKTVDNGPRNIDLDILLHGRSTVRGERLTIPHPLMLEREFVLRPLYDLGLIDLLPGTTKNVAQHLEDLPPAKRPMHTFTPLASELQPVRATNPKRTTHVMSILNVTPDSFSDGGNNSPTDTNSLKRTVAAQIAAGATIIDVGGQSSRPNAPDITAEEEMARILPAIEAIRSLPEGATVAISVDTYRAAVARAAVQAGAHIINDISAGLLDPEMLPTVARLGCTYIMMHMRGTPATMTNVENCSYPGGVVPTVSSELRERLSAAFNVGIKRWRIILDPGIGFAKTQQQNLELLRGMPQLRDTHWLRGIPWSVGTSRKSFIGRVTGVNEPKDRSWGTAATVTAAVQGGADIVRVHDVAEMAKVVKMADAMYRV